MTRLVWTSDTHFNMLKPEKTFKFGKMRSGHGDACVITGDIAEGKTVCPYLIEFQNGFGGDVYFVLGNHDRWHSSFQEVESDVRLLCENKKQFHWLGDRSIHQIGNAQLCGVDGWYDYQAGATGERINFIMNDWHLIEEFKSNFAMFRMGFAAPLTEQLQALGRASAMDASHVLKRCDPDKPVLFATHVPPYAEAAWYNGKQTDATHLPFYTNISLGHVLREWAHQNQPTQLTTICGHTHSPGEFRPSENHIVYAGQSDYGNPQISKVFDL